MTKIKVIIIDDEKDARYVLRNTLQNNYADVLEVIDEADGVKSGLKSIEKNNPDLVFLDIKMRDGSGFDLLQQIQDANCEIIFVTAYDKFAVKAFQFSAFGYLMKPVKSSELKKSIRNFQQQKELLKSNSKRIKVLIENYGDERKIMKLVISNVQGFQVMQIEDIIRLEGDGNYTRFILNNGKKETASKNLGVYEDLLSEYGFFRSHQSTLINLRHVTGFQKSNDMIIMADGESVKLSRYRKSEFTEKFI